MPRETGAGAEVISGCINQTGTLRIRVSRPYGESTVSKILDLVENASSKKSKSEAFITRFARYYTPSVVAAAALLAILPPLITGQAFAPWIHRALTFLVILPVCARNLCSAEFLRRHRRSFKVRCADQGKQLPGGTGKSRDCCV